MNELPAWLNDFNAQKLPDRHYLAKPWKTLLPIEQYTESTADDTPYEEPYPKEEKPIFPHDFPTIRGKRFMSCLVRKSPFGNTLTKELAIADLKGENMGKGSQTDFLAVKLFCDRLCRGISLVQMPSRRKTPTCASIKTLQTY